MYHFAQMMFAEEMAKIILTAPGYHPKMTLLEAAEALGMTADEAQALACKQAEDRLGISRTVQ